MGPLLRPKRSSSVSGQAHVAEGRENGYESREAARRGGETKKKGAAHSKETRTEVAVARVVRGVHGAAEGAAGDGDDGGDEEEGKGEGPAHPCKGDEDGEDAALPVGVAPEEVAPECLCACERERERV